MTFRVGMEVVAIGKDNDWVADDGRRFAGPIVGEIVVISAIRPSGFLKFQQYPGLLIFAPEWFRPVVKRKTSIAVFEAMLKPVKEDA
jgi:hypothetical protein